MFIDMFTVLISEAHAYKILYWNRPECPNANINEVNNGRMACLEAHSKNNIEINMKNYFFHFILRFLRIDSL